MGGEVLLIRELGLRVTGLSAEQGRGFAQEVARRIAAGLPGSVRPQRLGALDLHIALPPETLPDQLASLVAKAVLEKLS